MFFHKTPWLLQELYPSLTWKKNTRKTIYLTFDDGPIPGLTPFIQKVLSNFGVKATFFCVGENLKRHKEIAQAAIAEGHKIANHTLNHLNGWKTETDAYTENIRQCEVLIKELGVENRLFRPPYGRMTQKQIKRIRQDFQIIMWDVLTGDFSDKVNEQECLKQSIDATSDGSIILFHDNMKAEKNLRYALPRYVEHFLNLEFTFGQL